MEPTHYVTRELTDKHGKKHRVKVPVYPRPTKFEHIGFGPGGNRRRLEPRIRNRRSNRDA